MQEALTVADDVCAARRLRKPDGRAGMLVSVCGTDVRSIKKTAFRRIFYGGRWEVRTPDPLGVNEMLFQLS